MKLKPKPESKATSTELSADSLRTLGDEAFKRENFAAAINHYRASLKVAYQQNASSNIIFALNNLILTQVKLDPTSKALFGFYKLLYTQLNTLKQNSSKLYKIHRNKSIMRLMQAAEHIPLDPILQFAKGKIDSHTIGMLRTLHVNLKNRKLSVMPYEGGLGIKLDKNSETIIPTGDIPCVLAVYTGRLCRDSRRLLNGSYFPNIHQHAYVSPFHPTQQAYTVGSGMPLSLEWAADLCNDGTLRGKTLAYYQNLRATPCDETLLAFCHSYESNRQLLNNCGLSYFILNPETGISLEARKPIQPNEQLFTPYGYSYWMTKISYQYRGQGELTKHQDLTSLAFRHKIFDGQPPELEPFVNLSLIAQAIDINQPDIELTNSFFDSYNESSGYHGQTKGQYVLNTILICALSVVTGYEPTFLQPDNWQQIMSHENNLLPMLIANFSVIIQNSIQPLTEGSSPEKIQRINSVTKAELYKISFYALIVLELGNDQTFPSSLLLRLMKKGLFSLTLQDESNQLVEADRYQLTL